MARFQSKANQFCTFLIGHKYTQYETNDKKTAHEDNKTAYFSIDCSVGAFFNVLFAATFDRRPPSSPASGSFSTSWPNKKMRLSHLTIPKQRPIKEATGLSRHQHIAL